MTSGYHPYPQPDISQRIRSLLLSRNHHNPPKSPHPSPRERSLVEPSNMDGEESSPPPTGLFTLPRLILKDKKPPNMLPVRGCGSANGDDLACFLAGCKHPLKSPLEIATLREEQARMLREDVAGNTLLVPRDVAVEAIRKSIDRKAVVVEGPSTRSPGESVYAQEGDDVRLGDRPKVNAHARVGHPMFSAGTEVMESSSHSQSPLAKGTARDVKDAEGKSTLHADEAEKSLSAVLANSGSPDHNVSKAKAMDISNPTAQIMAAAQKGTESSSNNDRDFVPVDSIHSMQLNTSVPSPQDRPENGQIIRTKASSSSLGPQFQAGAGDIEHQIASALKSKPKTPSVLSGASRISSSRHALLKPSTVTSPIDNGLPVPPILSPAIAEGGDSNAVAKDEEKTIASLGSRQKEKSAALADLRKAKDLVATVEKQLRAYKITTPPVRKEPEIPQIDRFIPELISLEKGSEYWGFDPAVKDGVQGAVQKAVRKAVRKITVPTGSDATEASSAYRHLLGESLSQAAAIADQYLQRESLWVSEPDRQLSPISEDSLRKMLPQGAKAREDGSLSRFSVELGSEENSVPAHRFETLELDVDEDCHRDAGQKDGRKCKYGAAPTYTAIPTRESSRRNMRMTNSTSNSTVKRKVGPVSDHRLSFEPIRSELNGELQAIAASNSLEFVKTRSSEKASGDKLLQQSKPVLDGKSTIEWLKDLLSSKGSYETRFTEMPPRPLRDRSKAQTMPARIISDTTAVTMRKPVTQPTMSGTGTTKQKAVADTFSKTINDLELLLNEALYIARQAADKDDAGYVPALLGNAAAILKGGRKGYEDDIVRAQVAELPSQKIHRIKHSPFTADQVTGQEELLSVHESVSSLSVSDVSYDNDEDELDFTVENDVHPGPTSKIEVMTVAEPSKGLQSSSKAVINLSKREDTNKEPNVQHGDSNVTVTEAPIREGTNPFLSPQTGLRRASVKVSPRESKSRAESSSRKTSPSDHPVIYIDNHAVPEAIHGPPILESPPLRSSSDRGTNVVKMGNETRIESINSQSKHSKPSVDKKIQRKEIQSHKPRIDDLTNPPSIGTPSYAQSYDGSAPTDALDFETGFTHKQKTPTEDRLLSQDRDRVNQLRNNPVPDSTVPKNSVPPMSHPPANQFNLKGKQHVSLRGAQHKGFSFIRSHKKPKIARDWSPGRKRFVASVACISTALVGLLVGIYAAEVPAIQYYIVDFHHYVILGNVFFYIGLAISTFLFWPLPLLHGRKPYILGAMCLAMPLLFPQALAVGDFRSPYTPKWRVALLFPRSLMGLVLGFANMNFKSTLTDLFGASLMAANPHQEIVDENDVRRHGGGLGAWLGIWTWCSIGSIGIGFLFGAVIINNAPPAWGFYVSICIIAGVLLLNVICPEVRRSAFRRSVAEVKNDKGEISRRLAKGEVKMHMKQTGPKWWGDEFHAGVILSLKMLRQPGFMVLAVYVAWIYGQIVLIVVLLGSLMSNRYKFKSPYIGACVMAIPIGAALAIPFQKAGLLSRDRTHAEISDDDTRDEKPGWSSHLVRRAIFVIVLPFAGLAYTLSSGGPPIPFILPVLFAGLIGFLSALAMAECHGIIMETFDTSDLQPGMTGRPRSSNNDKNAGKRTNYSSFPRVSSGFAIVQCLGYLIASAATGVGGVVSRDIGPKAASGVMAGILLILSVLLLITLLRFRFVQIVPNSKKEEMEKYMDARRKSAAVRGDDLDDESLRPTIIGNPTHHTRRMNILEMGSMSRFSEIRKKNHLVDSNSLEAKHPNLAVLRDAEARIREEEKRILYNVGGSIRSALSRSPSKRSYMSRMSQRSDERRESYQMNQLDQVVFNEQLDLGGHRDMGIEVPGGQASRSRTVSGNKKGEGRRKTTIQERDE